MISLAAPSTGLMTAGGGSTFGYANNGLLLGRTNSLRTWFVGQRDGEGRILQTTTRVGAQTVLTETNTWRDDGRLSAYIAGRGDFTDSRRYSYSLLAQRLTQESLFVGSGQAITNNYTIDSGQAGGLGLLTSRTQIGGSSASWSGALGEPNRIAAEQTSLIRRSAYGLAPAAGTVSATLDGEPLSVQFDGFATTRDWRANMDLARGPHTLRVSATDPSGLYFASATNTFTCATNSGDTIQDYYYVDGNVEFRTWVSALGQTMRSQRFTWDAYNRLVGLTERDADNNGYNWSAVYDGLGRRLQTSSGIVTNGVALNSQPTTINSFYDPQVEFLELGVVVNGVVSLKTCGPDANGVYGGMQGLGGLETINISGHSAATGVVQDNSGTVIGTIANGVVSWNPTRFSSYGPVPGYQSPALSLDVGLAQSLGWRGKRVDETGYINLGARLYDSGAGRFLSADPLGHEASQDLYSFCGGDPVNGFDSDGRCSIESDLRSLYNEYRANNYVVGQAAAFNASMATGDMSPMLRAAGVDDFFNDVVAGAVKGEYATDAGAGAGFGNAVASSLPVWGQIAGVRDLSASVGNLGDGGWQDWRNWRNVGIYGLATVPFVGWIKGAARVEHAGAGALRALEVDTYGALQAQEVIGDAMAHHEIPSFAAIRTAQEQALGRELTARERSALRERNTAVELPNSIHLEQPTTGGKNTQAQVLRDALDLNAAARRDLQQLAASLEARGYSRDSIAEALRQIRSMNRSRGL